MTSPFSPPGFDVRPLTGADGELIYQLLASNPYYISCEQDHPITRAEAAAVLTDLPPGVSYADKQVLGVFQNGVPAALMDLILGYPEKGVLYIGLFLVAGGQKRRGLGRRLMGELSIWAGQRGFSRLRLGCIAENTESLPFWSALGFQEVGHVTTRAPGRRDWNVIVMEHPLTNHLPKE